MANIRGLEQILADFDRRQRPDARSRNRVITIQTLVSDTVTLSSDNVTTTLATPPYHWHDVAGTTATSLIVAFGEWRA